LGNIASPNHGFLMLEFPIHPK